LAIQIGDTCKRGHEIVGDNVQHYINKGSEHVRCKQCNSSPVAKKQPGDSCKNGHIIIGENMLVRKTKTGHSYSCRECAVEATRRYRNSDKFLNNPKFVKNREHAENVRAEMRSGRTGGKAGVPLSEQLKRSLAIDKKIMQDPTNPNIPVAIANVDMDKRSRDSLSALYAASDFAAGLCAGKPERWIDYPEGDEPSMHTAYLMCNGCPLLVQCARFANAYGPEIGVWGGEVWSKGKVKKRDSRNY
jgi:hypothetical protein